MCAPRCSRAPRRASRSWLLAQLLDYHRREARPQWWAYFRNLELDDEELVDEQRDDRRPRARRRARAGRSSRSSTRSSSRRRSTRSAAEAVDPATEQGYRVTVDDEHGTVTLRRGVARRRRAAAAGVDPAASRCRPRCSATQCSASPRTAPPIRRSSTCSSGGRRGRTSPARSRRRCSASTAATSSSRGRPARARPGSGARLAIALMRAGKRVGVTALSHKAIHKFLEDLEEAAVEQGYTFRGLKKSGGAEGSRYEGRFVTSTGDNAEMLEDGRAAARRHVVPLRAGGARPAPRRPLRRRGRPVRAGGRDRRRHGGAATSSCSATRTSCRRSRRPRIRPARARRCSSTCSATTRRCGADMGVFLERDVAPAAGDLRLHLGGVLRGPARAGRAGAATLARGRERARSGCRSSTAATGRPRPRKPR